jgi:hypothetical protein
MSEKISANSFAVHASDDDEKADKITIEQLIGS